MKNKRWDEVSWIFPACLREIQALGLMCFLSLSGSFSQNMFTVPLAVGENGQGCQVLWFGFDYSGTATRCIDTALGERELLYPPVPGSFDARFISPGIDPGNCLGLGTLLNIQPWRSFGPPLDTFLIRFQPGGGTYPMRFAWQSGLQDRFTVLRLVDPIGGIFADIDMLEDTLFSLSSEFVNQLYIFAASYWDGPGLQKATRTERQTANPAVLCEPSAVSQNEEALPGKYSLSQNFPNPFNPETRISYTLPGKSFVNLVVVNLAGQELERILSGYEEAGSHTVSWKPALASGVYLIKIQCVDASDYTKGFVQTKKMIYVK